MINLNCEILIIFSINKTEKEFTIIVDGKHNLFRYINRKINF